MLKSEPEEYSIDALEKEVTGNGVWSGVRNHSAKNVLKSMKVRRD